MFLRIVKNHPFPFKFRRLLQILVLGGLCLSLTACSEDGKTRFRRLNQEGDEHFEHAKYEAALEAWKNALEIENDHADIYRKIGMAHIRLAFPAKAEDAFRHAVRVRPDAWEVWLELGKLQLASLDVTAAEASWEKVRHGGGDNPACLMFHGDLMVLKKQFDEAESDYRGALSAAPEFEPALVRLAACYLVQGKTELAEATWQTLVSLDPASSEILLQMSKYWQIRGNPRKAEEYLLKAAQKRPRDLSIRKMLAEFYFNSAHYQNAQLILEMMLAKTPENRVVKKFLAETLLAQDMTHRAGQMLSELSQDGNDLELHLLQGKHHLFIGNPSGAAGCFRAALEKDPNLPVSHYLMALACLSGGQTNLARQRLIQVLTIDPYFSDADLALADIYYKQEAFDLSLEHARRVSEREPENARAHLIMGNVFLARHQYDSAIIKFETVRRLWPDLASPLYHIAMIAILSKQDEKALHICRTLADQHPKLADAALWYARLLIRAGETETARQFFEKAINQMPQDKYLHAILGEVYFATGETQKAKASFEQAIVLGPELLFPYLKLAKLHEMSQNREDQIQALKACIEQNPHFTEAYVKLADIYVQAGRLKEAIALIETGLTKYPESPRLANNLAWLCLEENTDPDKALRLAQFAHERLPEDLAVSDTLGWAYYKNNAFTQAVQTLAEASSRKPDHPLVHFHLGMALHAGGDTAKALDSLNKAISLSLEHPHRDKAAALIQELEQQLKASAPALDRLSENASNHDSGLPLKSRQDDSNQKVLQELRRSDPDRVPEFSLKKPESDATEEMIRKLQAPTPDSYDDETNEIVQELQEKPD